MERTIAAVLEAISSRLKSVFCRYGWETFQPIWLHALLLYISAGCVQEECMVVTSNLLACTYEYTQFQEINTL